MGGRIEVESEKNRGSTFSFSVWVGISENEEEVLCEQTDYIEMPAGDVEDSSAEDIRQFGTPENLKNLKNNLSKLILCVEMENWEKAEMFMETVRTLTSGAPREIGRIALRLKMAIQKENYDKITTEFAELNNLLGT